MKRGTYYYYKPPDTCKMPYPDPATDNTPTKVSSVSTLKRREETEQVLAYYEMLHSNIGDA